MFIKEMLKEKGLWVLFFLDVLNSVFSYAKPVVLATFLTQALDSKRAVFLCIALASVYAASLILAYIQRTYADRISRKIRNDMEIKYFQKVMDLPMESLIKHHSGYVQEIVGETINSTIGLVRGSLNVFVGLTVGMGTLYVYISGQSKNMCVLALIMLVIAAVFNYHYAKKADKHWGEFFQKNSELRAFIQDITSNILTVKRLEAEKTATESMTGKICSTEKRFNIMNKFFASKALVFDAIMYALLFILLGDLVYKIHLDSTFNSYPFFIFYLASFDRIKIEVSSTRGAIEQIVKYKSSTRKAKEIFSENEETDGKDYDWQVVQVTNGRFTYKGSNNSILVPDFKLGKGEKVSIMGESGRGKTTLLSLLGGMLVFNRGGLYLDGIRKKKIPNVGYIAQNMALFNTTIRENVCLGKEVEEDFLNQLFEDAGLIEWVQNLPDGFETIIAENAENTSDGQKMRLKLIRGIVSNKETYFLDEPTSNLDAESKEKIIGMICKYLEQKTLLISTHDDDVKNICTRHYKVDESGTFSEMA